jgi:hypothetical protein
MSIEEALKMIEDNHLEHDIKALLAKDRMAFYQTLKEFTRSKLIRSNAMPAEETEDNKKIFINIKDGNSRDSDIREDTQQE